MKKKELIKIVGDAHYIGNPDRGTLQIDGFFTLNSLKLIIKYFEEYQEGDDDSYE